MGQPSDRDLAQRARRGDAEAYGELVRRYQASVFNVCCRLLGERREAEDLVQEAFLRAYTRLQSFDLDRPFGPWMRRVAANVCFNHLQATRAPEVPLDEERDSAPADSGPESAREQAESGARVRAALAELPAAYRAVIELRHFQELSYAEIAAELKLPLSDVKSHLFRARKLLAEKLKHA